MNQHLTEVCDEAYIQWWVNCLKNDVSIAFEAGFLAAINWAREHKDEL